MMRKLYSHENYHANLLKGDLEDDSSSSLFRGNVPVPGWLVRPLQAYHCHPLYNFVALLL